MGDIWIFRNFMFKEHITNLEAMIVSYKKSMRESDVPVKQSKRQV